MNTHLDAILVNAPGRVVPAVKPENGPFFEGAARGELMIQRCVETGKYQFYPRPRSIYTYGEVEWVPAAGTGVVHSFTIVRINAVDPLFSALVPYCVALIELPEGVRMMTNITGVPVDAVHIGMKVSVHFAPLGADRSVLMPFWRPQP